MTFGDVLVRFYLEFLGMFALNSVLFLSLGVLTGCAIGVAWQRRRRSGEQVDEATWLDAWEPFEPGVARVGESE